MSTILRIPVVWNLAGGYQNGGSIGFDPVMKLHLKSIEAACEVYGVSLCHS